MNDKLWLIPAAPLLAAVLILFVLGPQRRRLAAAVAIAAQLFALTGAISAFGATLQKPGFLEVHNFNWFTVGQIPVRLGLMLDPLTAGMLVMITFVSLWIFVFSVGYMAEEVNFTRFFAYLSFFSAAMLGVVISNSLLLLFICWELVGLASYLLIGFWIHKPEAAAAAKKAFITTRIGDIGFFLGLLWLSHEAGSLLFYDNGAGCLESARLAVLGASATGIALLLFCGAAGKSGQFPLHVWLPDAMEGPTPVSALIHAATMVAAGVFLVARAYPIFTLGAEHGVTPSLTVVVWIGVVTALISSLIALAQADIKRILAYSTVSQLGLMMVALGVGGPAAAIMHLLTHGFFKALLFLGSGSIIHACHHEQDIRNMGGLRRRMPVTFLTYSVGMMALSGVPLLFSGAWTKEEIVEATHHWPVSQVPYYLTLLGVFLTSLYMTRQMIYVFFGRERSGASHAHENRLVMTLPLIVLAACAVLLSGVVSAVWPWLHGYVTGKPAHLDFSHILSANVVISFVLVAAGIGAGCLFYKGVESSDPLEEKAPSVFRFLENRMWLDELYQATVLGWSAAAARLADWMDRNVWDGLARGVGRLGLITGRITSNFDEGGINTGLDQASDNARHFARLLSGAHSGQVQRYLAALAVCVLQLILLYIWLA